MPKWEIAVAFFTAAKAYGSTTVTVRADNPTAAKVRAVRLVAETMPGTTHHIATSSVRPV